MERRPLNRTMARLASTLPAHVSIDGNVFRLINDAGEESKPMPYLDCVILDINEKMSRIYYGAEYQKGNPGRPLCFSDNGIAPSDRSDEPQAISCQPDPEGKKGCRWAVWGSDTSKLTGKGIPACRTYLKLAIMIVVQKDKKWQLAFKDNPGRVFFFAVPPASLTLASDYGKKCTNLIKIPDPSTGEEVESDLSYIITRLSFVGTGKVGFEWQDYITKEIDAVIGEIDQARVDTVIGKDDVPITALPAPQEREAPALPQPTPPVAPTPRPRGRPRKNGNAPVTTPARIVTVEEVRNHAAQQKQEAKEAEEENPAFGIEETEPPADVLDEFMNLDLK